ncbi:hypothetical protein B0E41_22275 [Hydrogenophaga sp. A37]|nr:hypothetical protein B0E41_22275 [Hydrogenophaga sp. A37]
MLVLTPLATWLVQRPASAHGDAHPASAANVPVVKEQKPWGIAAEPKEAQRTIQIRMTDNMRFTPSHLEVREGETLRLRAVNGGKMLHEIVIGTPEELQSHAEMMKKHPGMEHDEPYMAHVPAGKRSDITWTFNRAGDFEFACLLPGHFDAGMRGTIRVKPRV